jgi:hypothetical protein
MLVALIKNGALYLKHHHAITHWSYSLGNKTYFVDFLKGLWYKLTSVKLTNLESLNLNSCKVGDASIEHFHGYMYILLWLDIRNTLMYTKVVMPYFISLFLFIFNVLVVEMVMNS